MNATAAIPKTRIVRMTKPLKNSRLINSEELISILMTQKCPLMAFPEHNAEVEPGNSSCRDPHELLNFGGGRLRRRHASVFAGLTTHRWARCDRGPQVNHMVQDHRKDISKFEQERKNSGAVATFAQETLPVLKKHLEMAESLSGNRTTGSSGRQAFPRHRTSGVVAKHSTSRCIFSAVPQGFRLGCSVFRKDPAPCVGATPIRNRV
jgi:Domain of unknown function (DUF4142)